MQQSIETLVILVGIGVTTITVGGGIVLLIEAAILLITKKKMFLS